MTHAILLAALLAAGVAGAQSPGPVPIFVGPMVREGFVDVDQGVLDSIKDIQGELRKDRAFAVVAVEADAALKLYVVNRTKRETGGSVAIGTATGGVGTATVVPLTAYRLETLLLVGSYKRAFTGEGTWKGSARAVAKDLAVWVAANRGRIP